MANVSVMLNFISIEQHLNIKKYMQKLAYKLISIKGTILDTVLSWTPQNFFLDMSNVHPLASACGRPWSLSFYLIPTVCLDQRNLSEIGLPFSGTAGLLAKHSRSENKPFTIKRAF